MLDVKLLREDTEAVAKQLARRGYSLDVARYQGLEADRKRLQVVTQELQNERNTRSKMIGQAKSKGEDIAPLLAEVGSLGERLDASKAELDKVTTAIDALLYELPNILHSSVPFGESEDDNQEIRRWGDLPSFDFKVKSHDVLGEQLGLMDFAMAAKITGSRFVVMTGALVRMHRALTQFMLDTHISEHGYEEIYVPYIVNKDSLLGTGQLPKFEDDLFKLRHHQHDFYLTSTGEVPITNTVRDQILDEQSLPLQYVSHTPCFRSEAGSYGKDTKGMIRQHQFEKVEMVWATHPDKSYQALEQLTEHAENILKKLGLAYRVVTLCSADVGSHAAKTYDLEVWLPSQDCYREISSCSNCEDFQARRMHARFRDNNSKQTRLLHTLNGSGLAVGRTLLAIMENYQTEEGHIVVPPALVPYMGGLEIIK